MTHGTCATPFSNNLTPINIVCHKCNTPKHKIPEGKRCCSTRRLKRGRYVHDRDNAGGDGTKSKENILAVTKEVDYIEETETYEWTGKVKCGGNQW